MLVHALHQPPHTRQGGTDEELQGELESPVPERIHTHQEINTIAPYWTRDHDLDTLPAHALYSERIYRHDTDHRQQ
jgi:hypothetical protein